MRGYLEQSLCRRSPADPEDPPTSVPHKVQGAQQTIWSLLHSVLLEGAGVSHGASMPRRWDVAGSQSRAETIQRMQP